MAYHKVDEHQRQKELINALAAKKEVEILYTDDNGTEEKIINRKEF